MPHVGDIVLLEDSDKINELIKMLLKEIENRKELFSDYAGNYVNYCSSSDNKLPLIVIVINSYEILTENYNKQAEVLNTIMRDGSKYGIVFIVTTSVTNSMRSRVTNNFLNKICMQLSNDSDYRMIINAPKNLIPSAYFGRGLTVIDSNVFEFQTAYISDSINDSIKQFKDKSNSIYNVKAKKIPIIPKFVTFDLIKNHISDLEHVPIGISTKTKDIYYYNFKENKVNLILANNIYDKGRFLLALIKVFNKMNINVKIIDFANLFKNKIENNNYVNKSFNIILNNILNEVGNQNIYIFVGIGSYKKKLNKDNINKLNNIMNNSNRYLNSTFIIFDSYANYKNIQVDPWIKNKIDSTSGIWLGEGAGSQIAIQINDFSLEDRKINFPYMGIIVNKEFKEIIKCMIDIEGDNNGE